MFTPTGNPMETAPKDRPILTWCDHEADPYYAIFEDNSLDEMSFEDFEALINASRHKMTLYAAHADGMASAVTGFHIVVWGGGFDDSTWEYPNQASLPDWWFVENTEFEVAANPVMWWPLPERNTDAQSS